METIRLCKECAAPVPSDVPEGLCPKCLLAAAMESDAAAPLSPKKTINLSFEPLPTSSVGTKLYYFGDYELLEEIARGGMGVVYKARQTSLNRIVALKMILAGKLAGEAEVKRFRLEAEAAANLQHPNIVAIHEVGEQDGQHYFSMDHVEGKNLAQVLGGKALPSRPAAELVETIAKAIHYGHQRGTLHRDLKPQNVLIDASGQPRITDFGLAKRLNEDNGLTQTGAVMGSPSYMPPEQAAGRHDQIGPQSDVYSLGAILYELLTGSPPFRAETPMATMMKVRDEQPVKPTHLNMEVPRDLETICLKCLEKQPERRYPSARALAEDLNRFLNQEPILAQPISSARRLEFWVRKHPWALIGAGTFLLLLLLGLTYALWEQTSYLHWVSSHPEYARRSGLRTEQAKSLTLLLSPTYMVLVFFALLYRRQSRCVSWAELWGSGVQRAKLHVISPGLRQSCYCVAGVGIIFSLYALTRLIEAFVWEGSRELRSHSYFFAGAVCSVAVSFLWEVYREQHAVQFGVEAAEKREAVERPGTIRSQATSRIALFVIGVIIPVLCYLIASGGMRLRSGLEFLGGCLLGTVLALSWNKNPWRRFILIFSACLITAIGREIFSTPENRGDFLPIYMIGVVIGIASTRGLLKNRSPAREMR